MILIFGGTTEGRAAIDVCEQACKPYFYSTRGAEQEVVLTHGRRLGGIMDADAMTRFCRDNAIRLIVDAAHPFATQLHANIGTAAAATGVPVVRYERIYPPRDADIIWCSDFADAVRRLEAAGVASLLALTGVQTIGRLRTYWEAHTCWFRILGRDSSVGTAIAAGFPADRLVAYEGNDTASLITRLHPQAIITKESGMSGGFMEKVDAARKAGVTVFAVERPRLPYVSRLDACRVVDGPRGLRRAIEATVPDFFTLHTGLTTGTCATAAVVAAMQRLLSSHSATGAGPRDSDASATDVVSVRLPDGETVSVPVGYADGAAFCIKDFSDDPDVTRGAKIIARVALRRDDSPPQVRFLQGEGVGRVTLPGLGIPVGEPAINPTPRRSIAEAVAAMTDAPVDVTISVEGGRELALKTFNPRVGVVDGISIIGTSGIVMPFSNEAFTESIEREMHVAKAMGFTTLGLASGKRGEEALLAAEPCLRVVHYGNFIGSALQSAYALGFQRVVVGIMIGKAVKLAEGNLDTHSHKVTMNLRFLIDVATEAGIPDAEARLAGVRMARELWQLMPPAFFDAIRRHCLSHCRRVYPTRQLDVRIISDDT